MNESESREASRLLKHMTASDRFPRGIVGDPGFKLLGTPLGFSGANRPGLLFYGNIDDPLPPRGQRCIGTIPLVARLKRLRRNIDALPVDYFRSFRLGRMELRLLPAGMGPGSAMLEIKYDRRVILYCGQMRTAPLRDMPPAHPVSCDLLLIDCASPIVYPGAEVCDDGLARWLSRKKNTGAADCIVCHNNTAAVDMLYLLRDHPEPIVAERTLYELFRDLQLPQLLGSRITRLGGQWPESGLVLMPPSTGNGHSSRRQVMRAEKKRVLHAGRSAHAVTKGTNTLRVGDVAALSQLLAFARGTGTDSVVLASRCGQEMAAAFARKGFAVHFFHQPTQLPLPLQSGWLSGGNTSSAAEPLRGG